MNRKLLLGLFFLLMGISFIINRLTYQKESYAYPEVNKLFVRFYYLDETDDSKYLVDEKSIFQILNSNNEILTSFETFIGNDYIETTILSPGEYTLRQVKTSENYDVYPDQKFYLNNQNVTNIYILAVKSIEPKLAVSLTDTKTNKLLNQAHFNLFNDNNLIGSCITTKGYCYFNNIKSGNYTLENTIPASGYTSLDKFDFTVNEDKINYLNLNATATKLVINSYNSNTLILNDGSYQIYDLMNNLIYDLKDLKYVENIPLGSYYLKEVNTPQGYKEVNHKIPFTIEDTKEEQLLNIYYTKDDGNNDYLNLFTISGIIFTIAGIIYLGYYYKNEINSHNNNGDTSA